jgi:hypothetical protein
MRTSMFKALCVILAVALAQVAAAQLPDLDETTDFMNTALKADGRQLVVDPDAKCELTIVSWRRLNNWFVLPSKQRWLLSKDIDGPEFPRYTRFNLGDVDPLTVQYRPDGFSDQYMKRFYDENADVCKVTESERCERAELIAFNLDRADMGVVYFQTRDIKHIIEQGGYVKTELPGGTSYDIKPPETTLDRMGLHFTNQDTARRFTTAFRHAVDLCHGRTSAFPPAPDEH